MSTHSPAKMRKIKEKSRRGLLNFLFGRAFLILILMLMQLAILLSLFFRWGGSLYAYGTSYLLSLIMTVYLINRKMSSTSRTTWLILILLFPMLGTLFYLYVENDLGHRYARRAVQQSEEATRGLVSAGPELSSRLRTSDPDMYSLARYLYHTGEYSIYDQCRVEYYPLGEEAAEAMYESLSQAKHFIFLEFFIIAEGEFWGKILEILERKVKEGVEVRVMYDGTNLLFNLPAGYPKVLTDKGIACKVFSPIRPLISTYHNNRDHRKIVVIDGHTAFTGGINLADEYINKQSRFGHWKDCAIRIEGPAVRSYTLMFLQLWNTARHAEPEQQLHYLKAPTPSFPDEPGCVLPYGDNPFNDERIGETVYLDIINRARRYVHIMTPYLIIDDTLIQALTFAAKRGVEVSVILPHVPDKKIPFALAYTHYSQLLKAGVHIYEYTPGFVHAKVFICDDVKAVVGTINLDYRSLSLHFECGTYLYRVPAIQKIEADFRSTRARSMEITPDNLRTLPMYRRILGVLMKLFAPLL